tara:strand:- start:117 stop:752 length:636 start_codon:yes stop_codon:yes gene_type:complete
MVRTGLIYKLVCSDIKIKECYVGSTVDLKQRKRQHKHNCNNADSEKYNTPVYQFIREHGGWSNWIMVAVSELQFNRRMELNSAEREWVETLNATLNKQVQNRTNKEYYQDNLENFKKRNADYRKDNIDRVKIIEKKYYENNSERIKIRTKQYRDNNSERIKLFQKQIIECDCGKTYTRNHYSRHTKTKRHIEFETFMKMTDAEMLEFIKAI